jgi:UDP-N-acetylmuramyl pentapeptide phosphotransferase/UDP-N-acetylglucosamine-1-phosphate transferase
MAAWRTPAQRRNIRRRRRSRRFMSTPRAVGLVLMAVGVSAYGTAPDWLALSVGLLGLAATLFADARYLRRAIDRRHFSFLIDRAILLTALAVVAAIWLWRLIDSRPV